MKPLVLAAFVFSAFHVLAASQAPSKATIKIDKKKIERLVNDFYLTKSQKASPLSFLSHPRPVHPNCEPTRPRSDCLNVVCGRLDSYECDDQSEIDQVLTSCRGVDGACIEATCKRLDSYECDDLSEVQAVGQVCRSIFDGGCVDTICRRLDSYECDDLSEITRVGAACRGRVDSSCVESVCSRLDSYECDDLSELETIAKSCGGR